MFVSKENLFIVLERYYRLSEVIVVNHYALNT